VGEADLANKLELRVLAEGRDCLRDLEHTADDVVRGVAECPSRKSARVIITRAIVMLRLPKILEDVKRSVNLLFLASLDHSLDLDWMGAIDHTEDVVTAYEAKSGRSRL